MKRRRKLKPYQESTNHFSASLCWMRIQGKESACWFSPDWEKPFGAGRMNIEVRPLKGKAEPSARFCLSLGRDEARHFIRIAAALLGVPVELPNEVMEL